MGDYPSRRSHRRLHRCSNDEFGNRKDPDCESARSDNDSPAVRVAIAFHVRVRRQSLTPGNASFQFRLEAQPLDSSQSRQPKESKVSAVSETDHDSVLRIEAVLNDVDRALERLRAGTYRSCQVCGAPIDTDTLVEWPLLANCPAHPELS